MAPSRAPRAPCGCQRGARALRGPLPIVAVAAPPPRGEGAHSPPIPVSVRYRAPSAAGTSRGCPSWCLKQQCRTPRCRPLHDLHAGALCSSHRFCIGRRGCPIGFLPTCFALFCGGEGGRNCLGCPGTAPGGGGWPSSTCAVEAAASAPCVPPPKGWGWGSTDVRCSCPPSWGGSATPVADDPARAVVSRREMSPKISASPREGGGGCGCG